MSVRIITGHPQFGIPSGSEVRIFALPSDGLVWEGKASKSVSIDLEPGKYQYVVKKNLRDGRLFKYIETFMHEMTTRTYDILKGLQPRSAARMTSEGKSAYHCIDPGCGYSTYSKVAMLTHEAEHRGVNLPEEIRKMNEKLPDTPLPEPPENSRYGRKNLPEYLIKEYRRQLNEQGFMNVQHNDFTGIGKEEESAPQTSPPTVRTGKG